MITESGMILREVSLVNPKRKHPNNSWRRIETVGRTFKCNPYGDDPPNPPCLEVNVPELNINSDGITMDEIRKAVRQMKNGKAPGLNDISSCSLTYGRGNRSRMTGTEVSSWKFPKKCCTTKCANWREIILVSVVSKVFTIIILTRKSTGTVKSTKKGTSRPS